MKNDKSQKWTRCPLPSSLVIPKMAYFYFCFKSFLVDCLNSCFFTAFHIFVSVPGCDVPGYPTW
uniref:Ovule protein n=1 Tax=Heterorhabditis bacteriophora TaxID=37862 RepID=A0A1I7WHT0_HETBA